MVDRIKEDHLRNKKILIILKIDQNYVFRWEEIRNALGMLDCVIGTVIITASKNIQQAKEYCNPPGEPLDCSLVGLYHNTVLEFTRQQMHGDNKYEPQIFREILDKCGSHEFSMKIFVHALYSNPKRSNEDLRKLHNTLQVPAKSLGITEKMFKFSYKDLPKEYKSCLLYLAIFPQGHKIRRSNLIGRWVAEGLITTDDWRWSSSVDRADRCFDTLLDRWFLCPADIGATGKVKSCIVGDIIHEFIAKIAKKQRIVETRLSHHLARHFSVFNDIHLRGSDTIRTFFQKMHETSQLSQLKVLDLENCHCIEKYQHYLKDVCRTILLLKYLSLRGTYITQLPSEINNLRELEVLDIRQTKVPAFETRSIMLLKLKRLLAGHNDQSPSMAIKADEFSSVCIPEKIEKMINMEVLSNVKAPSSQDLKDIRKLWQLRKLGVVITNDKYSHFWNLFRTISDLHECLLSLSITLPTARLEDSPSIAEFSETMRSRLKYSLKHLQSLSITGTTKRGALLPLLAKDGNQLRKVTLTSTKLSKNDLEILANLPNLCCVRLQHIACSDTNKLIFKNKKFQKVQYFLIEGSNLTEITFETQAAPELEKIVLSFTGYLKSLSGVENLTRLEELELTNNSRLLSFFDKSNRTAKVTLRGTLLRQSDLQILSNKPNMRCLELLDKSYVESKVAFKQNEFLKLNLLVIDCSFITNISFARGSTPMLKKISWTFTNIESFSGTNDLLNLKELQFNGDYIPDEVEKAIKNHKNKILCKHNKQGNQDQANGDTPEEDYDVSRFPFSWIKNKVCL